MERNVARVVTAHRQREGAGFMVRRPFPTGGGDQVEPFSMRDEVGPLDDRPGWLRQQLDDGTGWRLAGRAVVVGGLKQGRERLQIHDPPADRPEMFEGHGWHPIALDGEPVWDVIA